jgi:hypothetical protein
MHKKISLAFTKIDGTYSGDSIRTALDRLSDGKYTTTISTYSEPRNGQQNRLYHVLLNYVSAESGNEKDNLHEMMKMKFLSRRKRVKIGKKVKYVRMVQSTSQLSTLEFSKFYEQVEHFFVEAGYVLPPHNSLEFARMCDFYGYA